MKIGENCEGNLSSQVALMIKNLPVNAGDTRDVCCIPGQEDSLEKGMAIHSIILVWKIPWTEEPGRLQFMWSHRVRYD